MCHGLTVLLLLIGLVGASPDPADLPPASSVPPPAAPEPLPAFPSVSWYPKAVFPATPMFRAMAVSDPSRTRLYLVGGYPQPSPVTDCWCYHIAGDSWTRIASLPENNCNQWAVWWEDDGGGEDSSGIFVLGRYDGSYYKTCYWWSRATNSWSATAVPEYPGVAFSGNMAAVIGDSIFLVHRNSSSTTEMHRYSIREGTWAARATPAVNTNYYGGICAYGGRIWQLGGWMFSQSFQVYQPGADQWTVLPSPPESVGGNGPILLGHDGCIWAVGGGSDWVNCNDVAAYDTASGRWAVETPLPVRVGATPGVLLDSAGTVGIHWATGNCNGARSSLHYRGVPLLTAVNEQPRDPGPACRPATVVRATLFLPGAGSGSSGWLLDAAGRRVMELAAGANDLTPLGPGIYFVLSAERAPQPVIVVR